MKALILNEGNEFQRWVLLRSTQPTDSLSWVSLRSLLAGAMTRWVNTIEPEVPDGVILPAHRVVQRMGSRVTPMAVEIILFKGRACTGQFE